jgi:hypothetical protein
MSELLLAVFGILAGLQCYFIADVIILVFTGYSALGIRIEQHER